MGDKSIQAFSAPSATNVATEPNVINGNANFELKPALIMMVLGAGPNFDTHRLSDAVRH